MHRAGFLQSIHRSQHVAEIVVELRRARAELHSSQRRLQRLGVSAQRVQNQGEVGVSFGVLRLRSDRLGDPASASSNRPASDSVNPRFPGAGVIRIHRDCPLVRFDRLLAPPERSADLPEVVPDPRLGWLAGRCGSPMDSRPCCVRIGAAPRQAGAGHQLPKADSQGSVDIPPPPPPAGRLGDGRSLGRSLRVAWWAEDTADAGGKRTAATQCRKSLLQE